MFSKGSDYDYRRQDADRNSRGKRGDYGDRREEGRDFHSNIPQDSYYKYSRDGHSSTDRVSKSGEYSNSSKRLCSSDSSSRDWSRKSPTRRRMSPPGWDGPEEKRRRHTDEDDANYRYKRDSVEKTHRPLPASFSRNQQLRYSPSYEDGVRYRNTSPYSRSRHQREELPLKKQFEDFSERDLSDCFKASVYQNRRHGYSQERMQSPDNTTKIQAKMRERIPDPSTSAYYDEYCDSRAAAPLNGSSGRSFESDAPPQSAALPEVKSSKGFQRFLDVLNKGVNVDVLTQIVSQTPKPPCEGHIYPRSLANVGDQRLSPFCTERQQKHYNDNSYWNESKGSLRSTSPQPHHGSASPNRNPVSVGESFFGCKSVEKKTMMPEDEQKHKQMQDVLQAIGMDLGFEELGQMSHRIQERLYGKRDNERGRRLSRERSVGQAFTVGRRSRSPSSRSSFTPQRQSSYTKRDSFNDTRDEAGMQQSEYSPELSRKSFLDVQDSMESKISTGKSIPALNAFPFNTMDAVQQPPPATMPPVPPVQLYSPISHLPLPYPTVPPPPLPFFPRVAPGVFFPRVPPMLLQSPLPPPNVCPPLFAQGSPSLPPHLQLLNPANVNAQQAMNTTKTSKTHERHRFLQVIK
ncbi:hypothetical protein AMECASPLE_014559 [Ameca splendens]|uniref:Uncharacterized protein n=1 Tax=Ameca splendens TaxID=208324 RepID=A0ABV0XQM7_9TELE